MNRINNCAQAFPSNTFLILDRNIRQNHTTDEELDDIQEKIAELLESGKRVRKKINEVYKPEPLENHESDSEKSISTTEKLQTIQADADEMIDIMQSNVEKAKERAEKMRLLASMTESAQIDALKFKNLASKLGSERRKSQKKPKRKRRYLHWKISTAVVGTVALIIFLV